MKEPTIKIAATGRIEPERIPQYVAQNIAQAALSGILRAYNDPIIRADYERWKAERKAREGVKA